MKEDEGRAGTEMDDARTGHRWDYVTPTYGAYYNHKPYGYRTYYYGSAYCNPYYDLYYPGYWSLAREHAEERLTTRTPRSGPRGGRIDAGGFNAAVRCPPEAKWWEKRTSDWPTLP